MYFYGHAPNWRIRVTRKASWSARILHVCIPCTTLKIFTEYSGWTILFITIIQSFLLGSIPLLGSGEGGWGCSAKKYIPLLGRPRETPTLSGTKCKFCASEGRGFAMQSQQEYTFSGWPPPWVRMNRKDSRWKVLGCPSSLHVLATWAVRYMYSASNPLQWNSFLGPCRKGQPFKFCTGSHSRSLALFVETYYEFHTQEKQLLILFRCLLFEPQNIFDTPPHFWLLSPRP